MYFLLGAFAASVAGAALIALGYHRYAPAAGQELSADARSIRGVLELARDAGGLTALIFGLGVLALLRDWRTICFLFPLLGTLSACLPPILLFFFSLAFIDCFSSCNPKAPSDVLWPAFLLFLGVICLGVMGGVSVLRAARAWKRILPL